MAMAELSCDWDGTCEDGGPSALVVAPTDGAAKFANVSRSRPSFTNSAMTLTLVLFELKTSIAELPL